MSTTKYYDSKTQKWEIANSTQASTIPVLDIGDNFQNKNVESALRELSDKSNSNISKINGMESSVFDLSSNFQSHIQNHPGGSGGSGPESSCVITSTFESGVIDNDVDLYIPLFLTPSKGSTSGTAYIMINNIEVGSQMVERGNNRIHIGNLQSIKNSISIYVRDSSGSMSEMLYWEIIKGGVDLKLQFDYNADYSIEDVIRCPYTVSSAIDSPLIFEITIDGEKTELPITTQGYSEYVFPKLNIGVHKVQMVVTSGIYRSKLYNFNLIIVSSYNLYVSSTFQDGEFESGVPIIYDYRISKLSNESFDVKLLLDGVIKKTLTAPTGSYTWTISSLIVGEHIICVEVRSNNGEFVSVTNNVIIYQGEYEPIQEVKGGLIANFSSSDMTNEDVEKELWTDSSGNNVIARLHDFNFKTNGWIEIDKGNNKKERILRCDNEAYVEIDIKPYENNIKLGSTIDILYKSKNIGFENARIIDYTDSVTPYKGFYADVNKTVLSSATNTGIVDLDEDTEIRLTYVIDRVNKFGLIYVNGVINRAFYLSDSGSGVNAFYEDFSHNGKIYLNSEKGIKNFGAVDIKKLRIYNRTLSDDEILQNHLSDIEDINEQKERYKFNFNNKTTPVIKIFCDKISFNNMSDTTSVPCRVKYESPNEDFFGQSFDLPYCDVNWQGTSSLQYVLKNYTIRLKDENLKEYFYTPYKNGIKESVFCLKADYMESSHSHNVGMAKFINSSVYDTKTPAQMINEKCRTTIDGFPILVYINYNDGNGDTLMGAYNFNLDRYSTESFGFKNFPKLLAYEVSANSDTTAGAFFKWTSGSGKTEIDYYKSDFEMIYPYSRIGNDNYAELIRLVNWVDSASDEMFKEQINEYFNLEYLLRYYLVVMVIGAVDSLGKNMKLITYDGLIWYPQFYDLDTIIGLDNTGFLKFGTDIEVVEGIFNTSGSKLWSKVSRIFAVELQKEYALMRLDRFTVDNMMKYVYNEQIQAIPEKIYNIDMKTKYLNFGSSYLYACHGNRSQQIKKWLRERLVYTDTLMKYTNSTSDFITLRSSKLGPVYLDIQTYLPMYLTVKWRDEPDIIINGEVTNAGKQTKKVGANETVRFEFTMPTATDQEIIIYAGRYLKSLGDVSNLKPTSMLLGNANKLTSVECHSPNLINVDLAQLLNVQHINLSDCTALGTGIGAMPTVDLAKCAYLKTLNFNNTKLTAIYTNLNGGSIEKIIYPKSIQAINVRNQERLKVLGVPYDEENGTESVNLANVDVHNCPSLERFFIEESSEDVFKPLKHVQNLTLMNSLQISSIRFDSFKRLKNISITNMYKLYNCEFNDLNNVGDVSTLQNIIIQNCPLVEILNFNVSSDKKSIMFMPNAILDLSQVYSLKSLTSNTAIKGLKTIILPGSLDDLIFENQYGSEISDIKNLWSYSSANPNANESYEGIDFKDLNIKDIDLSSTLLIPTARNLNISPVTIMNIQGNRDNVTNNLLPINGVINLTNYTGSCVGLFKGMDLTNATIIKENDFIQTDFSHMFEDSIIGENVHVQSLMSKMKTVTNGQKMFAGSSLSTPYMFSSVVDGVNLSEMYMDSCVTVDLDIPLNAADVTNLFKNCKHLTHIKSNWNREYDLEIITTNCYSGCTTITHRDEEDLYVNEVAVGLDSVPVSWGGYGFEKNITGIYEFIIPSDDYTINLGNLIGDETVSWGDNSSTTGINSHLYKTAGKYFVKGHVLLNKSDIENELDNTVTENLINVFQIPTVNPLQRILFKNCSNLLSVNIKNIDTFNPINITDMFTSCSSLLEVTLPVEPIKVSSNSIVKDLFKNCHSLTSLNINLFSFTNVTFTDLSFMFYGCMALTELDLSNFDTSNVTDMSNMFSGCESLVKLNLLNFNVNSTVIVTDMLLSVPSTSEVTAKYGVFLKTEEECSFDGVFSLVYPGEFARYTFNKATADCLPYSCSVSGGYSTKDLKTDGNIVTRILFPNDGLSKPTTLNFTNKTSLISIINIDTSNLSNMSYMFYGCSRLTSIDLSSFDTSKVTDMNNMFSNCISLTSIDLSSFDTSKVTDMNNMFQNCTNLTSVDLSSFDTTNTKNISSMFRDCPSLKSVDLSKFNTTNITGLTGTGTSYLYMLSSVPSSAKIKIKSSLFNLTENECSFSGTFVRLFYDEVENGKIEGEFARYTYDCKVIDCRPSCSVKGGYSIEDVNVNDRIVTRILYANDGASKPTSLNFANKISLISIINIDTSSLNNFYQMFHGCTSLTSIDASNFNTSKVTSMSYMFYGCSRLTSIDLSSFDTSKVTDMNNMFQNCTNLTSVNLSSFDTIISTTVSYMFKSVPSSAKITITSSIFTKIENECTFPGTFVRLFYDEVENGKIEGEFARYTYDVGIQYLLPNAYTISNGYSWKDVDGNGKIITRVLYANDGLSKPTALNFTNKTSLISIINIDTSNLNNFYQMFYGCSRLTSIDLSSFDTSKVTDMNNMFSNCISLTSIDLSSFDTSKVTDMNNMFSNCSNLTSVDLSSFDTTNTKNISYMFYGCKFLKSVNFSNLSGLRVTTTNSMFYGCSSLTSVDLSSFRPISLADSNSYYMFTSVPSSAKITVSTGFYTILESTCSFSGRFNYVTPGEFAIYTFDKSIEDCIPYHCTIYGGYSIKDIETVGDIVTRVLYSANGTSKPTSLNFSGKTSLLSVTKLDTSKITDMSSMFYGCTSLTSLDLSSFSTLNVIDMSNMFLDCKNLTSLDVSSLYTRKVTTMYKMFYGCTSLASISLLGFKTSNVITMGSMFCNCTNLTLLDLSSFDTSKVNDMSGMFHSCTNLTPLDLSNFNTLNVTNMSQMFYNCTNLTKLDLIRFNTPNLINMSNMFYGCISLKSLDLSNFNTSKVTDTSQMLLLVDPSAKITVSFILFTKTNEDCNFGGLFIWIYCGEFVKYTFDNNIGDCVPSCVIDSGYFIKDVEIKSNIITRVLCANDSISKPTSLSFYNKPSLVSIERCNTSRIINMDRMFANCTSLKSFNSSNFDTSKVTNMSFMFSVCESLVTLDLSGFNTSNVDYMSSMFKGSWSLKVLNLSSFDTKKIPNTTDMFTAIPSTIKITITSGLFTKTESECSYTGTFIRLVSMTYINELPYTNEPQILSLNNSKLTYEQILEITEKGYTIV